MSTSYPERDRRTGRADIPAWGVLLAGAAVGGLVIWNAEDVKTWIAVRMGRWPPKSLIPGYPPIPSSVTEAELLTLQDLARDKNVVEFGSAYGYSTVGMALVANSVISVDPQSAMGAGADLVTYLQEYGVANVVTMIASTSQAFCATSPASADLVFIDGDHSFSGTLSDLQCAQGLVGQNLGAVAIHDYRRLSTVNQAVNTWAAGAAPTYIVDSLAVFTGVGVAS